MIRKHVITDELRKSFPNTCAYIELFGNKVSDNTYEVELISTFETPSIYKKKPELLYEECIKLGKKWTDIVPRVSKNVIL